MNNCKKQTSQNIYFCFSSTVKYEAPKHISMSWLKNNLSLSWTASEKHPAAAEILLRRDAHRTDSWGKVRTILFPKLNTTEVVANQFISLINRIAITDNNKYHQWHFNAWVVSSIFIIQVFLSTYLFPTINSSKRSKPTVSYLWCSVKHWCHWEEIVHFLRIIFCVLIWTSVCLQQHGSECDIHSN